MRKKVPENEKRKKITVSLDPRIYSMWERYCVQNDIKNYSEYIEKLIVGQLNK